MADIGFIGLGIMGKPMCRNLLRAGYSVAVYDVVAAPVAELAAEGAKAADGCAAAAADVNVVITMLPDGPQVEEAITGPGGVLEGARPGTVVIDMSSINPMVSQKMAAACEAKGVEFLDAPVSGGEPKAIDGTLAIMAGGRPAVFEKVTPILQKLGVERDPDRRRRRGQRHQTGESDHGGLQHRRHGRSAAARNQGGS